jgi:hypothetical protein
MPKYWHLCLSGDQVVLLDLRENNYSSYSAVDMSPLSKLVPGWPIVNAEAAAAPISENDDTVVELIKEKILTTNRSLGKEATSLMVQRASEEILQPRSVFDDHSRPR